MEVQDCVAIVALCGSFSLTELFLHARQFLLFFLNLLVQQDVLILQELYLGEKFVHLDCVFLPGVFKGCDGDVFACDKIFHVLGRICLFFRGKVMVEIYFFDLGLFLLGPLSFLEVLIGGKPSNGLSSGIYLLYFINQFLQFEVAC